jgi:predicted phage-related endonuclease
MTGTTTTTAEAVVILDAKAIQAVAMLRQARELAGTMKALEDEAKAILNEALPTEAHGVDAQGNVIISRKAGKTSGVDAKALKASHPDIHQAFYRETNYTKLVLPGRA